MSYAGKDKTAQTIRLLCRTINKTLKILNEEEQQQWNENEMMSEEERLTRERAIKVKLTKPGKGKTKKK